MCLVEIKLAIKKVSISEGETWVVSEVYSHTQTVSLETNKSVLYTGGQRLITG